jgi:hypothetical protein
MLWSAILIVSLLIANLALSQPQPQAPQVKSTQQSESATKDKEKANDQKSRTAEPFIIYQPNPSNDLKDNTCDDCKKRNKEVDSEFWTVWGHRIKITDSWLAAFTGLLVVVTGGLIAIGWIQWSLSRDIARRQLRAYCTIVVSGATYQERSKGLKFKGLPRIINTGNTPAHKVGYRASAAILPIQLPNDFTFPLPTDTIGAGVLGAQHYFDIGAEVDDFCDDSQVEDIKHGIGKVLYIWGIVTYDDVFGRNWETWFCQSLTWVGEGKDTIVYGYYNPRHNKAT